MRNFFMLLVFLIFAVLFTGCGGSGGSNEHPNDSDVDSDVVIEGTGVIVFVEKSISSAVMSSVEEYVSCLESEGLSVSVVVWSGTSEAELKQFIVDSHNLAPLKGVLLVGDLPVAWVEAIMDYSWGEFLDEFPCDLYLMDLDGEWSDTDGNGIYDQFPSEVTLEVPVSRVPGTVYRINNYFSKVIDYRENGSFLPKRAFIFRDDDWSTQNTNELTWGLEKVYSDFVHYESFDLTTRQSYLDFMTSEGAEYVFQWIHSSPSSLSIVNEQTESFWEDYIGSEYILQVNIKGSFYNLFDCSAMRFTEDWISLGEAYLHTDYGLAVVGSTKTGAMLNPSEFHSRLSDGWGYSFVSWFNEVGNLNMVWSFGMVIFGDPFLKIQSLPDEPILKAVMPSVTEEAFTENLDWFMYQGQQEVLGSYQDYLESLAKK